MLALNMYPLIGIIRVPHRQSQKRAQPNQRRRARLP